MIHTTLIVFLYILILCFIALVIYKVSSKVPSNNEKVNVIMDDIKEDVTLEDVDRMLNWMFKLGVIDAIEYNKLRMDCLPFTKRNR